MSVSIGTQLGSYEITALLGKGGMGEVYRARDTKLKRDVAIKILPDEFSRDPDRVSRFQREAEVLASLNHTNIAAIHDLQESNGSRFLILELVEGETLADRIARRALSVDEALSIARQICEALEAAHEKGIIHRDLKPANVKVTGDGKVKVLDFGLAKVFEAQASKENLSQSPTLSIAATNAGVILGTAAYMSPEQTKGRALDTRTDIFAFGCVLYEMLTGQPAFKGEDVQDILSAVLKSEPDLARLPSDVPPLIPRLLRLCLQKDARKRRQTVADVRIDLEQAFAEPAAVMPAATHTRGPRLAWIAAAAAMLLVVVLAIPTVRHLREAPPAAPHEMRTEIVTPATNDPTSFAVSPDGRQFVFVASGDGQPRLWLRSLDAVNAQSLDGTEGATYPFWSPDSRSVGFFAGSKLKRIDIDGSQPQVLIDATNGRGGTWNKEGIILFAPAGGSPILRIPASGGAPVVVTTVDIPRQNNHRFPQFLPDDRRFLFYAAGSAEAQGIYLGSLDAPETKRLTAADTAGFYLPSGWLLYVRQSTLVARHFDPASAELSGDPVTVADPVDVDAINAGAFSVSATGLVSYRAGGANRHQLTWFDRSGKALGTVGSPDENTLLNPNLSPDGRRVAVNRTVQGNTDIWLLDGARTTRFTFDPSVDDFPLWSPDGNRIVFRSNRKGINNLYQKPTNGVGSEQPLLESQEGGGPSDWSADGRFLIYQSVPPKTRGDEWVLPLEGDRTPRVFLQTEFDERHGQFSPDGHWVAYRSDESGRVEIYVRPFPGPGGQWQVSTAGGIAPRWRRDGKELYYIAADAKLMAVPIAVNGAKIEPGTPVELFQTRIFGGGTYSNQPQYAVAPDGRFLINTVLAAASSPITLLQNWKPPAK